MDKVKKYLEEFKPIADQWFKKNDFIKTHFLFFQDFFKRENLERLEWKDIQKMGENIHAFKSVALAKGNALGNPNHPIDHYKKVFIYLAHGQGSDQERFRNILYKENYKIKYFGGSAISEIIGNLFAEKYVYYNERDRFALEFLGIEANFSRGDDFAAKFFKFNKVIKPVIHEYSQIVGKQTDLPISLEIDQFFSYIYEIYGGKNKIKYWKIAPGENAWNWENCINGGFIAIGWDEFGDIAKLNKNEFDNLRDRLMSNHPDWNKTGIEQIWKFSKIKEGDKIIANNGTSKLLGIGTVIGDYYFVPNVRHGHRLPVEWEDTSVRTINENGWRRTLIEIKKEKFEELLNSPIISKSQLSAPFDKIFENESELNWALDLIKETFQILGIQDEQDERFALTLVHDKHMLRLNIGNWAVLQFASANYTKYRLGIALIKDNTIVKGDF